ncbi:hypothetical protein Nmel_003121 [Mimus melanotis]
MDLGTLCEKAKVLKAYYLCGFGPLQQNILFTTTNSRTYFGVVDT